MTNNRQRKFIERVARDRSIPNALTREIVDLAQGHLKTTENGGWLRQSDVVLALDEAQRQWSGRLRTALDTLNA